MPELALCPAPPRAELVRQLRARAGELWPALRVIAEDVLGADATIDWVALEPGGRVVAVLVGESGQDLELVARALAQRAWLEPRIRDWLQLAPRVGLRPEAGVRALLVCPGFRSEAIAAARALGPDVLTLASYRCVRDRSGVSVLLEPIERAPEETAAGGAEPLPPPGPAPEPFRTGLSDLDLGLTAEERHEFERMAAPRGGAGDDFRPRGDNF
jgi:hypothetical protein